MEFKAITTQEEFDKAIKERLTREKEKYEKQIADYEIVKTKNNDLEAELLSLKNAFEESKTKTESYDKNISELNAKIVGYETANLKTRIALENGIPYNFADRIVGDDEESIKADALKLAGFITKNEPVAPLRNNEPPIDDKNSAYRSLLENLNLEGE